MVTKFTLLRYNKKLKVEMRGDAECIGISIPDDAAEMQYFSKAEAVMIAYAILGMVKDMNENA